MVSSSGRPSNNFSVPIRVCTVSGVWVDGGTLAAYVGADGPCAQADAANSKANDARMTLFMTLLR
jgi:hypothetical protein